MKNISDDKKADVLISALEERYTSIHNIRDRVQNVCLWALGIAVGGAGWLIQSNILFWFGETLIFLLALAGIYWVLRYVYFADLEKGFKTQLQTAAKIEGALHLYEPKYYASTEESIYPAKWRGAGSGHGEGKFFVSHYRLLELGLVIFGIALLMHTCLY